MDLDLRLDLTEKMLEEVLRRGQFRQALESLIFAYEHFETTSIADRHIARVAAIVKRCLRGLAGSKDADSGQELAQTVLLLIGEQVAKLISLQAYTDALPLARCAVDLSAEFLSPDCLSLLHPLNHLSVHLMNLGVVYESLEQFSEAEQIFQRGLTLSKFDLEPMKIVSAFLHLRLAVVLIKAGHKTGVFDSLESVEQHLVEAERLFKSSDSNHPMVAAGMSSLNQLRVDIAAALRARTVDSQTIEGAMNLGKLALAKLEAGEYSEAESTFERILSDDIAQLPDSSPLIATTLNNLGWLYQRQGLYRQARTTYQRAFDVARAIYAAHDPKLIPIISNLAIIEGLLGNFTESEVRFREALALLESAGSASDPRLAAVLDNFGTLYESMGHYERAMSFYRRALDIYTQGRSVDALDSSWLPAAHAADVATCLTNLANAYHHLRLFPAALTHYRRALEILKELLSPQHPLVGLATYNIATVYADTGNLVRAWQLFEEALTISRLSDGPRSANTAQRLLGLGQVLFEVGQFDKAEKSLEEAAEIIRSEAGAEHPWLAIAQSELGRQCVAAGRIDRGLEHLLNAQGIYDRVIEQVFSIGSEAQRLMYVESIQTSAFGVFSLIMQHLSQSQAAINAGFDLALKRKALSAEAAAVEREAVLCGRYPELRKLKEELSTLRARIAEAMLYKRSTLGTPQMSAWTERREQLEGQLARQIPEMAEQIARVDRRAVADAMPSGTALIEILRTNVFDFRSGLARGRRALVPLETRAFGMVMPDEPGQPWSGAKYLAFVMHAGRPDEVAMVELGDAQRIDELIVELRSRVPQAMTRDVIIEGSFSPPDDPSEDGRALRAKVFDPLLPLLKGCARLFIAPDGDLSCLPFEILPTDDGRRLIDFYTLSYLSAGRDILRYGHRSQLVAGAPLVVADPDFDLAAESGDSAATAASPAGMKRLPLSGVHFDRLHGARAEGEQIGELLRVAPLMDEQALKERIKAHPSPRILHMSTHGYFLPDARDTPAISMRGELTATSLARLGYGQVNALLRSGLALAGANTMLNGGQLPPAGGDGILNGEDVSGLDLLVTELVVLSACETGIGDVRVGEGVFGLRRAFVLAGAKTLVMSLWKVPDLQTRELMVEFYRRLQAGEARAEALRQAQLSVKARFSAPFYWGGFILQGAAGRLPMP